MLADPPQQRLAGLEVLVVDDDAAIRSLLGMALSSEGADVHMSADGKDALDEVRQSHRFDLIILDLSMPVMDGRTFYRELRALPCDTPVLLLSAYGAKQAQRELGAQAAIDKPFDPFTLVDRVLELITESSRKGG